MLLPQPDLAPSVLHLFRPLNEILRGRRFFSDMDVPDAVQKRLQDQLKIYYQKGIRKLVACWTKCFTHGMDHIEKYCICCTPIFV
ncbi:hypothetical protein TNIN_90221 [Trichonephila inaurata madagascariensis]|uniref:Uncharacterized protein n=1 Tax=Trichonephila inaurata madagascariensis TaxID=2747483 RepID=A0A8X6YR85_9ARAC|nr:hypothetical protein TNIN_90221 [Trichonephila inaurata madagascariensis]